MDEIIPKPTNVMIIKEILKELIVVDNEWVFIILYVNYIILTDF
jgi:hypothetical protein